MRAVDVAMAQERPEKGFVRDLWYEEIRRAADEFELGDEPLYLTLPGALGHDIQMLIDRGLFVLTEVASFREEDQGRIVAIESNNAAVIELQRRYPGLKIYEHPLLNLVQGQGPFAWPDGENAVFCRARVVNLDLNSPLMGTWGAAPKFPVLSAIAKLSQLHARDPALDWTLCLTLHGEVEVDQDTDERLKDFVKDNMTRDAFFACQLNRFLGKDLTDQLFVHRTCMIQEMDREQIQRTLMVLIPKLIAHLLHSEGWEIETTKNLRYGDEPTAPIVTWIMRFRRTSRAQPNQIYSQAINSIFDSYGKIVDTEPTWESLQ